MVFVFVLEGQYLKMIKIFSNGQIWDSIRGPE